MPDKSSEVTGTTADAIVARLREWDVHRIYGYSGDGINGLLESIRASGGALQFVQARHEENAALMAVGEAKFTGGVGVVLSTQGPGAAHLLNGLYDAKLDGVPVVAFVAQQKRSVLGSGYMQEINLRALFADVASEYVAEVTDPEQVPQVIDRAFRHALAAGAPTVVILPHDIQSAPAPQHPHEHGVVPSAALYTRPVVRAPEESLRRAAIVMSQARRPVILVGKGAAGAAAEIEVLAEKWGAGVVTSLLGKPWVDETLPYVGGTLGHLGTTASAQLLTQCDGLLIVGSNDPWTEFYPAPGQSRVVQIDIDPRAIGNRSPVEVGLAGDAASALRGVTVLLDPATDAQWPAQVAECVRRWHRVSAARAAVRSEPINPELAMRSLNAHVPDDALIALDVGSVVYWYARQLVLPRDVRAHVSGTLASMGCGVPYGLGAKLSADDRPVVVLAGDGGMQMTGVAELITVAARWRHWRDPRFVVAVFDNRDLAEVSWEQREMESSPRFEASQELPEMPYDEYAAVLGLGGRRVNDPEQLDAAWAQALGADRPFVLAISTDPATPLLPPLAQASAKLDPMRRGLDAEAQSGGAMAERARRLLDEYVGIEQEEGADHGA